MWTDLTKSPVSNDPSGFNAGGFDLSSVVVDRHDATGRTVYATVMGFTGNGINAPHLYRSVDGGAHWTNISSNLPNAPANGVVVDPNDANTLYIAMDTGVYVTTEVTSCTTSNCWSVYGTSLPNAPVVELEAAAAMPTGDGRTGELRAATYGRGIWQIPLLTAVAPLQPAITLSPASLVFSIQPVGTASAAQTVTVTNAGNAALTISSVTTTGDFNETDSCTAVSVGPGLSCTVQVRFLPTATGSRSGVLTVYGNVAGGEATASLSGDASAGSAVILTPVVLTFPATVINATSALQNITISNTGASTVTLQTPVITGDFKLTANTCGASLGPNVGCTVSIAFAPTASGARTGTFAITDQVGTQTASLAGTGSSPATDALSPLALTFAAQQITTASAAQQVILTNSGDLPLTLIAAQITSGDFTAVNACGNSLNPHSSCSISVAFEPKNVGALTGLMAVSDQYRTQTVILNGAGTAPPGVSFAPFSTVSFPNTGVGTTAPAQTVTLTNNGGTVLDVRGVAVTGDFSIVAGDNACGASLAAGAACTIQIVFAPTVGGPRTGTLTVNDNGPNSQQSLQLAGAGVDFQLTANGSTSLTIASGQNAVFPLLLSSAAGVPGTATIACTGLPANATCDVAPASVALGSTATISMTVLTGVAGPSAATAALNRKAYLLWVATLSPLGLVTPAKAWVVASCRSRLSLPADGGIRVRSRARDSSLWHRLCTDGDWAAESCWNLRVGGFCEQRGDYAERQPYAGCAVEDLNEPIGSRRSTCSTGADTGGPGPLEVVSTQPPGYVDDLADEVETGDLAGLHGLCVELCCIDASCCYLCFGVALRAGGGELPCVELALHGCKGGVGPICGLMERDPTLG